MIYYAGRRVHHPSTGSELGHDFKRGLALVIEG
jgi:hypothetical protein